MRRGGDGSPVSASCVWRTPPRGPLGDARDGFGRPAAVAEQEGTIIGQCPAALLVEHSERSQVRTLPKSITSFEKNHPAVAEVFARLGEARHEAGDC
jgi:hypothetical protein